MELFRQRVFLCFSIRLWNCSDSVVFFVFLLDYGTVPTGVFLCFSIRLWNCSDSVYFYVFLLDYGTVPTVCIFMFFY
jgi:hypothetical protein